MKKMFWFVLIIVAISSLLCACGTSSAGGISKKEQIRMASNNMQNGSHFTTDGEFLYFTDMEGSLIFDPYIYKLRLKDFSLVEKYEINSWQGDPFEPYNLICIEDALYYYEYEYGNERRDLYCMDIKKGESQHVDRYDWYEDRELLTDGDYYYAFSRDYFDEYGIFKASVEEINKSDRDDPSMYTKISDIYAFDVVLQGDYLFVSSRDRELKDGSNENVGLWRMGLNGENPIRISETAPRMLLVAEEKLVFVADDYSVYSMALDGTNCVALENIRLQETLYSINITEDYIFYRCKDEPTLHRVNHDGSNDIQLTDYSIYDINIVGDWVIYTKYEDAIADEKIYKMHFDGSNHCAIDENYSGVEDSEPTETTQTTFPTKPMSWSQGMYTLEEAQEKTGLFVRYSDGSFDRYYNGAVLTWDTAAMTYGADSFPVYLVIGTDQMQVNKEALEDGQLVLFWPYENRVRKGLYEVYESGYSLFRIDDDGDLEGLIKTGSGTALTQWNQGHAFYFSNDIEYTTINGVEKGKFDGFPSTEGREFASFPPHQKYTVGVVEGTTLKEKVYWTDHMYFLHSHEETVFELIYTTDGYAIVDFSNTPPGEYVFTVSRWDPESRGRKVYSTYIAVE